MGRHRSIKWIVSFCIALIAAYGADGLAYAGNDREVRLFVVEKSINPQNLLVVYAKVDEVCEIRPIAEDDTYHLFDLYWLMDGTRYKPTHPLIKRAARKRFVAQQLTSQSRSFTVRLADLKELNHDLPSDRISVQMHPGPEDNCQARVVLVLGPRHASRTMVIESIYSEAETFCGIPVGIHYIELRGKDIQSNEPIVARFTSKHPSDDCKPTDPVGNTNKISHKSPGSGHAIPQN